MISKTVIERGREYKCSLFKRHLKLRHQQLKTITYKYRLLIKNLIVATNQKSIIDIHTKKEKESKHNTKDSRQITREENKRRRNRKKNIQKQIQNN